MKKIVFVFLLLNLVMFSCKVNEEEQVTELNGTWKVIKLNGKDVSTKGATCFIDVVKKEAGGSSSCNTYGATLTLDENAKKIAFGSIVSTKIACENSIETDYYNALQKINSFDLSSSNLLVLKENATGLVELSK